MEASVTSRWLTTAYGKLLLLTGDLPLFSVRGRALVGHYHRTYKYLQSALKHCISIFVHVAV